MQIRATEAAPEMVAWPQTRARKHPVPEQFKAFLPGIQAPKALPATKAPKEPAQQAAELHDTAKRIEQLTVAFNKKLEFVVDHQSHNISVKVIDPATDKVIKILPPEAIQRLHDQIQEMIGLLFDEQI
jgi:flagellar protein FlaG